MTGRYPHLMLDIETLGATPDAPILSLAAVPFAAGVVAPVGVCFHVVLDLQAEYAAGAKASQSTLEWWAQQSPAARQVLDRASLNGSPPVHVAAALSNYVGGYMLPGYGVWGNNGASFDPVLVAEMFRRHDVPLPWKYSQIRCHRTLLAVHPHAKKARPTLAHDALADAYARAQTAAMILAERTGEVRWWATCTSPVRAAGSAVPERPTDETMPRGNSRGSASPRSACCVAKRTSAPRGGSPPETGARCAPATWCSPAARLDTDGRRHGDRAGAG